ncbi:unnamed protein product [Parnassius apollo]|uniref:(apollo) hypothetical protein n=1 Tax=Parnassius apollo TaxID=110799 RepID=A0A8S3YB31_PARAO|nr:unnamed protein product [Parnassius apollo]
MRVFRNSKYLDYVNGEGLWCNMDKNLSLQQIQDLLNDLDSDENVNEDIFPDASSDLSDAESEISDHNTESEEEA